MAVLLLLFAARDIVYWTHDHSLILQSGQISIGTHYLYGFWSFFSQPDQWLQVTLLHAFPMSLGVLGMAVAVLRGWSMLRAEREPVQEHAMQEMVMRQS